MRSILVHTARDKENPVRLDTAMNLARSTGGHVTLLIDTPVDRFVSVDPYGGAYVAREALEAALAEDEALAEMFSARLAHDDVPFDVAQAETSPLAALTDAAALADLAVVSRGCGFAGDLAVESSCPVLVTGQKALSFPLTSACIAWDGGKQAAKALRAAVPLLQGGTSTFVLQVTDPTAEGFPATNPLRYLARHGIKAELVTLPRHGSVEETLSAASARNGAELLVMGAFSHSRVRELLFGGVTRYFLDEKEGPALLLTH